MANPSEPQLLGKDLAIWHRFDPAVKADLFSTAVRTDEGICLIDPIALDPLVLYQLQAGSPFFAIVVTNQNHWRASGLLAKQLSIPIYAQADAQLSDTSEPFISVVDHERIGSTLEVIAVEGAAPGEISLFMPSGAGTLIVGDALINFDPYGFTFLPAKYCVDHRKMRKSIRQLTNRSFERMFFAHGLPIISGAGARLRDLLNRHDADS